MSKTRTLSDLVQTEGTITLPSGTTAERPANPAPGQQRFNTDVGFSEVYNGNDWQDVLDSIPFEATGGTETTITDGGVDYKVHTFTSSGTFSVISGRKEVEYLVVAGGGSGGRNGGGGGGAGGYRSSVNGENSGENSNAESPLTILSGNYTVTIGAGGPTSNQTSNSGSDSTFHTITSIGGGGGGDFSNPAKSGGSGGGAGYQESGTQGNGTNNQGFDGGDPNGERPAGGGGGAGALGQDSTSTSAGDGGTGIQSSIDGASTFRAGGGGGAGEGGGAGGAGGGGDGSVTNDVSGSSGVSNTGGGGGGSGGGGGTGGAGGSGIVIIRYQI